MLAELGATSRRLPTYHIRQLKLNRSTGFSLQYDALPAMSEP